MQTGQNLFYANSLRRVHNIYATTLQLGSIVVAFVHVTDVNRLTVDASMSQLSYRPVVLSVSSNPPPLSVAVILADIPHSICD